MTNLLTPNLIESLQIPQQRLTIEEWESITDGNRPQCPPCCPVAMSFAAAVRSIRNFDLDYQNALYLLSEYRRLSVGHNYTIFPALMKLVNNASALVIRLDELRSPEPIKKADPNVKGLAGYASMYDDDFEEVSWGL